MPIDPVGVAGTALGATSLLVQVFQGCVKGFELWQKGEELGNDALIFQARLEMQAARLKAWGADWGLDRGPDSAHLKDHRFEQHGDLAVRYIVLIHHFLDQLKVSGSEFEAVRAASNTSTSAASSIMRLLDISDPVSPERQALVSKLESIQSESKVQERLHWALKDGGLLKALDQLKELIDDLQDFFKPPKTDPIAKLALNSLLATISLAKLEVARSQSSGDSELQGLAHLRQTILEMNARDELFEGEDVKVKERFLKETSQRDEKGNRSFGIFAKNGIHDVLVEWKLVDVALCPLEHVIFTYKSMVKHRIENLARLLKADFKPTELRALDCVGVVTKYLSGDNLEHGLLFQIPSMTHKTLHATLESEANILAAGDWYDIARTTAKAVLFLHLAGWLHKGIRSDNLLFFQSENDDYQYDKPYLVGFEYSREATSAGQTEGVADDFEHNLYRHPDVQGLPIQSTPQAVNPKRTSFSNVHDFYSLGLVLLEVGLRETAKAIQERASKDSAFGQYSAAKFRNWLLEKEVPKLGPKMGKGYRDATKLCLDGGLNTGNRNPQEELYLKVVRVLDGYRVD